MYFSSSLEILNQNGEKNISISDDISIESIESEMELIKVQILEIKTQISELNQDFINNTHDVTAVVETQLDVVTKLEELTGLTDKLESRVSQLNINDDKTLQMVNRATDEIGELWENIGELNKTVTTTAAPMQELVTTLIDDNVFSEEAVEKLEHILQYFN
ncbi:hypothetical protein ACTFIW_002361 [Dictyostelium discoideum]